MKHIVENTSRLFLLFSFVAFVVIGVGMLDPDFGWHIKLGEIIATSGFPKTDPFLYTMPSYPYIDYEWLTNVIWYYIYPSVGMLGLSLASSLIVFATLRVLSVKTSQKYFLLAAALCLPVLAARFGVRAQVVSWLFFAVCLRLVYFKEEWQKYRFFLPPLFVLWTNLHASYFLGIGTIFVYLTISTISQRRIVLTDWMVGIVSLLATLINPYGIRNWEEVVKHMSQTGMFRQTVLEWVPFYGYFDFSAWATFVISVVLIWRYKKSIPAHWYVLFVAWFVYGLSSIRHMPLFAIAAFPILTNVLGKLDAEVSKNRLAKERLQAFVQVLCVFFCTLSLIAILISTRHSFKLSENNYYPVEAVSFINEMSFSGNALVEYGWAGYFLWKVPNSKVFMDGRAPGFRWDAPEGESDQAFFEYLSISKLTDGWEDKLQKYKPDVILWSKTKKGLFDGKAFADGNPQDENPLVSKLKSIGWKVVYEDQKSFVLTSDN